MYRIRLVAAAVLGSAGLAFLAACGAGYTDPGQVRGASAAGRTVTSAVPASSRVKLAAGAVEGLGPVLTDQDGRTLYRFAKDGARPSKSTCDGDCAARWPPLLADGPPQVTGVQEQLVGLMPRDDGGTQVTVGGWPVYRYAKDSGPGIALGDGSGGTWTAVTPGDGRAVAQRPSTAVATAEVDGLGTVLTDQDGMTLYLFTKDGKQPPKSACDGDCARTWPPLVATGETSVSGVDGKLVGQVLRPDGTRQVTVGGWPVYRHAKDTAPGQATGHGAGGTWFALEPNGCKVPGDRKPAASGTPLSG
ncbi:hypothetical protein [Amycolatopsis sp. NPDC058986]|uniref:hypothetical protein n=1 Tax=unclassified Amycolatopsis TaxID=2618356 RepID=UPI003670F9C3